MPIRTGAELIAKLDGMKPVIRIDGNPVMGPLSKHPAFAGTIRSKAALYDLQNDPSLRSIMTYPSPSSGDLVGLSYLIPSSAGDLENRRRMAEIWARGHDGWLGRAPDYMNTALMVLSSAAPLLGEADPVFGARITAYYEACREQDLSLAHSFIRPLADRHRFEGEAGTPYVSVSVVEHTPDGLIVDGARLMVTQGGISDELMVFPPFIPEIFAEPGHPLAVAFALPSDTPGISYTGRRPFHHGTESPLASQYDEIDMVVRFDHVLVPWDRVFAYGDIGITNRLFRESGFYPHALYQSLTRFIAKTEFFTHLLKAVSDLLELSAWGPVKETVGEALAAAETLRAFQIASEAKAATNRWGVWTPAEAPLYAAYRFFTKTYPTFAAALQRMGSSHLLTNATEKDFLSENGAWLKMALAGPGGEPGGGAKSRLFHLAWDAACSSFASRHVIYEQYFFGDPRLSTDRLWELKAWESGMDRLRRYAAE